MSLLYLRCEFARELEQVLLDIVNRGQERVLIQYFRHTSYDTVLDLLVNISLFQPLKDQSPQSIRPDHLPCRQ